MLAAREFGIGEPAVVDFHGTGNTRRRARMHTYGSQLTGHTVVYLYDMTGMPAYEALEARIISAQRSEALIPLARGMAHDFNNLLSAILATVELLEQDLDAGTDVGDLFGSIHALGNKASEYSHRLLSLSQERANEPSAVDAVAILQEIRGLLEPSLAGIAIHVAPSGEPCAVRLRRDAFEQVLLNLIFNARDAMPQGGVIRLEVGREPSREDGEYVAIVVQDTGAGIPEEHMGQIFQPFYTTKGRQGTGLGLAVCQSIVREAGGMINIWSEVGRGTRVSVILPAETGALDQANRLVG